MPHRFVRRSLPCTPPPRAAIAALLFGSTTLTGCSSSSPVAQSTSSSPTESVAHIEPMLKVTGACIRQPVTAEMAAGYFTITNTGGQPDELTSVTSDIASMVTMHRTTVENENQMEPVESFTIPAGGTLALRTGGNHLMLMGLKQKPTADETVTLHLRFAVSDSITVQVPVKPTKYQPSN
ncbi:copper chaperone PCu(A)C [Streptomyces sp. NPDC101194]|uniref:copper chaperone PCu(A)C n=1 Tax=Streptomyces sp. NPDC101194 TaxID=3366127 RepID=UPI00381E4566